MRRLSCGLEVCEFRIICDRLKQKRVMSGFKIRNGLSDDLQGFKGAIELVKLEMIMSAGECEDTEYFLNKLKGISSNSIWVYERKNVLENGYWYMLTFDKQNKKVFGNQVIMDYL